MKRMRKSVAIALTIAMMAASEPLSVSAVAANPSDTATKENVLEVLEQYDPNAYHIMDAQKDRSDIVFWFRYFNLYTGMDTAVHETYHSYTFHQYDGFSAGEKIYFGGDKNINVSYSAVYDDDFVKTEEMAKNIPAELQTFRYDTYVAPGATPDANTKGVFGLLNEFTAYYWGLEVSNSLTQFLVDKDAAPEFWESYVSSIGNNMNAYAEFKYWTLRYMLYIKEANPSLYQRILDNQNYCTAYRDADTMFVSEIERSRKLVQDLTDFLSAKGCRVDWTSDRIMLRQNYTSSGCGLEDYSKLMTELEKTEYVEMDTIIKQAAVATQNPPSPEPAPEPAPGTNFIDVNEMDWFYEPVKWAVDRNVTSGTSDTTFSPQDKCTREQAVTFLWNAEGKPQPTGTENPFTDIKEGDWFYNAVLWAAENDITAGMGDGRFGVGQPCTRGQIVTFLHNYAGKPDAEGEKSFNDVSQNDWFYIPVRWAVNNDITAGTGNNNFSPMDICTRGQIVTFLYNYMGKE